jgi:hypothetical protein
MMVLMLSFVLIKLMSACMIGQNQPALDSVSITFEEINLGTCP